LNGDRVIELIEHMLSQGVRHMSVLMRHSAREFAPDFHELENPLTPEGRDLALRLGKKLPKRLTLRGYASPVHRCMETAELVLAGHRREGGESIEHRPMEALGPFFVLDGAEAVKGLQGAGALQSESGSLVADGPHAAAVVGSFVQEWVAGKVPRDVLIPADTAARIVFWVLHEKYSHPPSDCHLDVCVTHDMTVMLLMDRLLGQPAGAYVVEYLDGLVAFEQEGGQWLQSVHGPAVRVTLT
jgi:broad specificity phosphatase PhoE